MEHEKGSLNLNAMLNVGRITAEDMKRMREAEKARKKADKEKQIKNQNK